MGSSHVHRASIIRDRPLGQPRLELAERLPALGELLLQPLPMQLQDHVHDRRIVGGQDPADLVGRHLTRPEYVLSVHRRSFGVVNRPTPSGSSTIPSGVPITVSSSMPPVANRIVPSAIEPRLGNSGPTHPSSFCAIFVLLLRIAHHDLRRGSPA